MELALQLTKPQQIFWMSFSRHVIWAASSGAQCHHLLTLAQLQSAFDSCDLPVSDRVSLSGALELAQECALDSWALPIVSTLCHAWLHRMRGKLEMAECVDPVAAAVEELLPAPISAGVQSWGMQPHQSSSSWMATWRVWRTVANALHMSGILSPKLPNDVMTSICTQRSSSLLLLHHVPSCPVAHATCRVANLVICLPQT